MDGLLKDDCQIDAGRFFANPQSAFNHISFATDENDVVKQAAPVCRRGT